MHPGQKAAIIIVLAVILVFGVLTGAAYFKKHGTSGGAATASENGPAASPAANSPAPPAAQPYATYTPPAQPAYTPPPQPVVRRPPAQQGGWNAQNLAGTTWAVGTVYGNIIVTLNAGGSASASTPMGPVNGTWRATGNSLTVSAMGQSYTCRIQGWQIIAQDGIPITQL